MISEETTRQEPANPLLRACHIVLPDEKARSAAAFIVSYVAMVVCFGAIVSHVATMIA